MSADAISADLALAHELADAADAITLGRFLADDLTVSSKPDATPVSDADLAAERAIRAVVRSRRPGDAVLGEEDGEVGGERQASSRRWIVDPIDGTKSFVRGVPVWATLIALQQDGHGVVGVVSAPALGRRWWGAAGLGAHTGGSLAATRQLRVSAVDTLADASLSYSSHGGWAARGRLPGLLELSAAAWRTRAYGDFWSHVLVAEGAVDASFEPEVSLWDVAALQPIVEQAGGRLSDLSGADRADGGSVVCSNGLLHEQLLTGLAARS